MCPDCVEVSGFCTSANASASDIYSLPVTVLVNVTSHLGVITGKEYMSDAEALADVQNPDTSTESGHIRRDVKVTVEEVPLGAATNIF